ncbi:hypothetical protein T459_04251 [Capsicum annuum]|uniref:Uncharacterized protein n=1 Tax=Capsicum annuum TaxID=4072 RepID=A0A2G3A4J1_CAPAN|nr:hypothetical protein T459_04251 [Capsicum annuum]
MLDGGCDRQANGFHIRGFSHMRKVITIYDTHLHGKYEAVLLSAVAQKLKSIVVDGSDLCFISNRHKSITNGIVRAYNHAHHGLEIILRNSRTIVSRQPFPLSMCLVLRSRLRAHFPSNRYDVMTTNIAKLINSTLIAEREYSVASIFKSIAKRFGEKFRKIRSYVLNNKDSKFVPAAENIIRDNMREGNSFYVENVNRDDNQFTLFSKGLTAKVNLLEKSCFYRKYNLFKI